MNTNLIKNQLKRTKQNIFALLLLFSLSLNFACVDSPDDMQVISPNPFGVGIIVFNSVPAQIFGNGIDQDTIKINTGLIPDGSSVTARITGTNLESNVAGCVLSGSANIVNGMATFDFLHPIFIGTPGLVEPVNLAVDIIIPGDDTPDTTVTDFVSLLINAVSITPPGDNAVTPLPLDNPFIEFVDFEFVTTGIPPTSQEPSIFAECMVSNPDLGVVDNTQINGDPNTTPVFGTTEEGRFIAKYFIENGTLGGNQILTCMITLPNPQDIDPGCPNVPENKRKITAELLIEHNPADPTVANDVTCTPNPIIGGNDGFCTCNAANAAGLEICIESGGSTVDIDPSCGTADANGTVVLPFETDVVVEQVIDPVVCTVTEGLPFFAQTNVTVNPAVVNSLICEPNPVESDEALGGDENSLLCTCDTNALQTQICFETVVGDGEINFPEAVDPFCVDSDANGSAIMIADVDGGITEQVDNILECCVDADGDNTCDTNATAQETVTITPFEPPVTSISCTAQQTTLGPDGNTFIDIVIDGFPFAQEVCAQIEIDSEGDATVGPDDDTVESPEVACSITDGNGEASIPFNAPPTIALQRDVTLRCFPDTLPDGAPDGEFTPGEISDIEVITLDPNAGPPPVQVACNVNPGTVEPGEDAFLTATLSNAGVGTDVCFEITTDTNPVSELMDDDEDFANDDIVCSQTNVANQAFATFQADPGILIDDNAIITCCADIGGGAPDGDCAFDDPQTTVNVAVDVPTISIACEPQTNPIGPGDDTFINITTTGVAPDDGMGPDEDVCVTIIGNTAPISEVGTPPSGITACSIVDALGNASIQFRGGDVPVLDVADIRCFVDNLDDGDTFTPGEISVTNQVTVDPNAAPPAPEIACSPNPATVLPGDNSFITANIMNAAPGADICFEIFTNTGPLSQLDDDNDTDDPDMTVPVETVCSTSNVANQAFASFEADAGILGPDTAVVQCCIDQSGMDPADGCDPIDPQGNTAINVDPPPPSIITISAPAGLTPMDGDTRAIDVATNLPVPAGTQICLFMQDQDGVFPELNNTAGGDMTTAEEPFPTTNAANTICLNTIDDSGQLLGEFELDFSVVGVNADVGDTVTVVGCIDSSNGGLCGLGEPLSNALVFTIVGP